MSARPQFTTHLPPEAIDWLACGRRGISSNTLFSVMFGIAADERGTSGRDMPHDPSDFRRCRLMVQGIPGAEMQLLSVVDVKAPPVIRAAILGVVDQWDLLCAVQDKEVPNWVDPPANSTSPRLYRLLQDIRAKAALAHGRDVRLNSEGHLGSYSSDGTAVGSDAVDPARWVARTAETKRSLHQRLQLAMMAPLMLERGIDFKRLRTLYALSRDALMRHANTPGDAGDQIAKTLKSVVEREKAHAGGSQNAHYALRRSIFVAMRGLWLAGRFEHGDDGEALQPIRQTYVELERAVMAAPPAPEAAAKPARKPRP